MTQTLSTIVDNDFLILTKEHPGFELAPKIKVYARISPENKALIVRTLK
jgi:magnesium-transporting ATPase (P-type)